MKMNKDEFERIYQSKKNSIPTDSFYWGDTKDETTIESKIIIVTGRGHTHNELLSHVVNRSQSMKNNIGINNMWEPYPSPVGTFMRHSDDWFLSLQSSDVSGIYNDFYREADHMMDSMYQEETFHNFVSNFLDLYHNSFGGPICFFINCVNPIEVSRWADMYGIPTLCSDTAFEESRVRSHYIQMEFSPGAAHDVDYDDLEFNQKAYGEFLFDFWHLNKEEIDEIEDTNSNLIKVNINKIFDMDIDYLNETIYKKIGIKQPVWGELANHIYDFERMNFPINKDMQMINSMPWEDVCYLACKDH